MNQQSLRRRYIVETLSLRRRRYVDRYVARYVVATLLPTSSLRRSLRRRYVAPYVVATSLPTSSLRRSLRRRYVARVAVATSLANGGGVMRGEWTWEGLAAAVLSVAILV